MTLLLLLAFLTGIQGVGEPRPTGAVTGVITDAAGKPVSGVRVGALAVSDSTLESGSVTTMLSLSETDSSGRYRLQDIPTGRYYIAAGRLDFPTFYPGTPAKAQGTVIAITSRGTITGIDFALQDSSVRPVASAINAGAPLTFSLPVEARVEGGGKLPVFSPSGFLMLRLTSHDTGINTEIPITASTIPMESQATFYGVRVLNVPPGYRVQSITADKMDLASGLLNLSALPFRPRGPTYPDNSQMIAGASLSITLAASPTQTAASGVMVTGRAKSNERRSIYISGAPGIFYADGTFEFRGVPPGLHRIATVDNPGSGRPLGAAIVVGGNDLQGVELDELSLLPEDIRSPVEPRASGANPPGFAARLAVVRVAVVDPQSRESAGPGAVYVLGPLGTSFDLPPDGRFEFPGLLPGAYRVEIQPFRRPRIARTILVEDKDIDLELLVGEFEGR